MSSRSQTNSKMHITDEGQFSTTCCYIAKTPPQAPSDEVLAQVLAAEDVHVEVHDGLAGVDALVGDDAETVLQAFGLGDFLNGVGHGAHSLGRHVVGDVTVMLLGNHERMDRSLGVKVVERDDLVVLVDNGRGDLVVGDFADNAITHSWFLSNRPR